MLVAAVTIAGAPIRARTTQIDVRLLVDRAITAAGGAETLSKYPAMSWNGAATIHAGGRTISIVGTWTIEPPDRAFVQTRPADQPPASNRALLLDAAGGWTIVGDKRTPMSAEMLAAERDAFYAYWLMRILPLADTATRLESLPRSTDGLDAVRVTRKGRPDVDLFFDGSARLRRLSLMTVDPMSNTRRRQTMRLDGDSVDKGVRWFKTLVIDWEDQPYFELTISDFQARAAQAAIR